MVPIAQERCPEFATGGDGECVSGIHRAQYAAVATAGEAVLHGADVPARTAAKGALPAVLSDRRGGAGNDEKTRGEWRVASGEQESRGRGERGSGQGTCQRRGGGRGSHRDGDDVFRPARARG